MKHKWLAILVLGSLFLMSFGSVFAQEPQPPTPPQGALQTSEGKWYMPADTVEGPSILATGGPDQYGYTWDDSQPFNWIDASSGTNTGMSGYGEGVGPIALPFIFPFYENAYSQIYISAYGYLTFTNYGFWEGQTPMPNSSTPNNLISPYLTPTHIGSGAWVRYLSGGVAPNRYFVVEWHDVKGSLGGIGSDDTYRFQVVLHENGDIVFQYQSMVYLGSWYCGTSGIENATGQDGLTYRAFCTRPFSGTAVRFAHPVLTFFDVPTSYWAQAWIESLYNASITGGCTTTPLSYCPENQVTRAQMAVFLEKGLHYPNAFSPANVSPTFSDTVGHWAEDWIEALKDDGVTSGCGAGNFCPEDPVTRAQMALFLLKSKYGSGYTPPAVGVSTGFNDVPVTHWAAAWIKQLAAEGITGGCGTGLYCPDVPVTRAQMAVFLVRTFNLP